MDQRLQYKTPTTKPKGKALDTGIGMNLLNTTSVAQPTNPRINR